MSLLSACDETDEPATQETITFFEADIVDNYPDVYNGWIVVHDKDGTPLWYRSFPAGDHLQFDSTFVVDSSWDPTEPIGVTVLQMGENFSTVTSYLGVEKGDHWKIGFFDSPPLGVPNGELVVTISDPDIGAPQAAHVSRRSGGVNVASSDAGSLVFDPLTLWSNADDVFISVADTHGNLYYKYIENASAGNVQFSLADLTPMESSVHVAFPPNTFDVGDVFGFEPGQAFVPGFGYTVTRYRPGMTHDGPVVLGYSDILDVYYTDLYFNGTHFYGFRSLGEKKVGDLNITGDISASIADKTFENFQVAGDDFNYRESFWKFLSNGNSVDWRVYADPSGMKNVRLPEEMLTQYPILEIHSHEALYTRLFIGSRSIGDIIGLEFKNEGTSPIEWSFDEWYKQY